MKTLLPLLAVIVFITLIVIFLMAGKQGETMKQVEKNRINIIKNSVGQPIDEGTSGGG